MFRFDDIWLGLIARKANVEPFHCPEFHSTKSLLTIISVTFTVICVYNLFLES